MAKALNKSSTTTTHFASEKKEEKNRRPRRIILYIHANAVVGIFITIALQQQNAAQFMQHNVLSRIDPRATQQ